MGIDGATWDLIEPLVKRGELPAFRELVEKGAYKPRFETLSTTTSPIVWTSVATGRRPEAHGIDRFKERLPNGAVIPITSNARRVKAIWNIATENDRDVGVIGWWASWPAERVSGYMVTDHANPASSSWMLEDRTYWTADPEALAALERDFYPEDLAPLLQDSWIDRADLDYEEFARRGGYTDIQQELFRRAPWSLRSPYSWIKTFYAVDYGHFRLAQRLARERPVDLQMLYLRGPDPAQHRAWHLFDPEAFEDIDTRAEDLDRDRGLVEGVYRVIDSFLAEILATLDPSTVLVVASDHGGEAEKGPRRRKVRSGGHSTDAKGVLFLYGAPVVAGKRLERGDPLDLMPTFVWLLGLPMSVELPGKPLIQAFDPDFVARQETPWTATYGERKATPGMQSPIDEKLLERLRGLGYIQ